MKIRKRITTFILLFAMVFAMITPATPVHAATKTVKIAVKAKTKKAKKTVSLKSKTKIQAMDGKKQIDTGKVKFKSSNKKVATISKKGVITAKKVGKTVITIRYKKKTAQITLTVIRPVKSVKLNKTSLKLKKGGSRTLTAKVYPENATNRRVTWASENKKIATVNSNGMVTGKKAGTTTVTVTTNQGKKVAACEVTVTGSSDDSPTTTTDDGQVIPTDPDQGGNADANEVTVNGVVFDVSEFPANVEIQDWEMLDLAIIPKSKVNDSDMRIVVNNNNYYSMKDLKLDSEDVRDYAGVFPSWTDFVAYGEWGKLTHNYIGQKRTTYGAYIHPGIRAGQFEVAVYYKRTLIKKSNVNVTKANEDLKKFRAEVDKIKANAWKEAPVPNTLSQKLQRIQMYVSTHYPFGSVWIEKGSLKKRWNIRRNVYPEKHRFKWKCRNCRL